MLDTEITKSLVPTPDVVVGSDLAFAPGSQANLTARKEWGMSSGNTGHWQLQMARSEKSFSVSSIENAPETTRPLTFV